MPYKDPITGCQVLSMTDFVAQQAEHEGIEPYQVMDDVYQSMANDEQNEQERLKIPENAAELLIPAVQEIYNEWVQFPDNDEPPRIVRVIAVTNTKVKYSFSSYKIELTAIALATNNKTYTYKYEESHYHGTRLDPPEHEVTVTWE